MEIYIAADGRVLSYILDPNFEKYLPIIPSEVSFKLQLTLFLVGCLFAAC
ncbi:Shifted protein [Daphnia magna]|uniref:Shifted protein n=1 Tax=Daphnia magna TaxID=35525 RepID=A0A164QHX0_9CRUS|nr:Shifted protein [Daphnia magna]